MHGGTVFPGVAVALMATVAGSSHAIRMDDAGVAGDAIAAERVVSCDRLLEFWTGENWHAVLEAVDGSGLDESVAPATPLLRIWALASLGRLPEARAALDALPRRAAGTAVGDAAAECAALRLERADVERRLERLEHRVGRSLDVADELLMLASALVLPSEGAAALQLVEEALRLEPHHAVAASMRREVLSRLNRDAAGSAAASSDPAGTRAGARGRRSTTWPPEPGDRLNLALDSGGVVELVWIPPGEGLDRVSGATVRLDGFWMMRTEVTQRLWQEVMGFNPSTSATDPDHPVDSVTWFDVVEFAGELTRSIQARMGLGLRPEHEVVVTGLDEHGIGISTARVSARSDGRGFRLPTEVEWEHACRGGRAFEFAWGEDAAHPGTTSWLVGGGDPRRDGRTGPVGTSRAEARPNRWGLFDMHGNVAEWCWDARVDRGVIEESASQEPPREGVVVEPGTGSSLRAVRIRDRIVKGGSMRSSVERTAASSRRGVAPAVASFDVGVRLLLPGSAITAPVE